MIFFSWDPGHLFFDTYKFSSIIYLIKFYKNGLPTN